MLVYLRFAPKDSNIETEISWVRRDNHHQSKIYVQYFYLKRMAVDVEPFLLARLADSVTVNSALATCVNCISDELRNTGNKNLARAVIAHAITNISYHRFGEYLERGQPVGGSASIYRSAKRQRFWLLALSASDLKSISLFLSMPCLCWWRRPSRASLFDHLPVLWEN